MTIAIVIGTHGWAAEQLLKTAEMLLGEQDESVEQGPAQHAAEHHCADPLIHALSIGDGREVGASDPIGRLGVFVETFQDLGETFGFQLRDRLFRRTVCR